MWNEQDMLKVCERFTDDAPAGVVVKEPYIPYKPENWNGILVLAESQAIPSANNTYAKWLKKLTPKQRMIRLGLDDPPPYPDEPEKIGIGPWDDGSIKLALEAMFGGDNSSFDPSNVAVGNAVPWTYKSDEGKNKNPNKEMQFKAAQFWKDIFDIWQPGIKVLVLLGNIAKWVMGKAGILSNDAYNEKYIKLRLPSPNAINRVFGMFDTEDLVIRFPEVKRACKTQGIDKNDKGYNRKMFFACHAVSLGRARFKEWFTEIRSHGN